MLDTIVPVAEVQNVGVGWLYLLHLLPEIDIFNGINAI